jgi:hypothetical protein
MFNVNTTIYEIIKKRTKKFDMFNLSTFFREDYPRTFPFKHIPQWCVIQTIQAMQGVSMNLLAQCVYSIAYKYPVLTITVTTFKEW